MNNREILADFIKQSKFKTNLRPGAKPYSTIKSPKPINFDDSHDFSLIHYTKNGKPQTGWYSGITGNDIIWVDGGIRLSIDDVTKIEHYEEEDVESVEE